MNILLVLAFLFFMGCEFGWIFELFFRRFISLNNPERKWINPGFLVGPYLPIYGFGLSFIYLLTLVDFPESLGPVYSKVLLILLMGVVMTVIEYLTGCIFIKKMHLKLWDYSREWGNIQGIICPRFSLLWTVFCALYYILIHPHIISALEWLSNNLAFSFFIGLFYGLFIVDVFYSANLVSKLRKLADEYEVVVHYDELKASINENRRRRKEKIKFMFIFGAEQPIRESMENYRIKLDSISQKIKNGSTDYVKLGEIRRMLSDKLIDRSKRSKDKLKK